MKKAEGKAAERRMGEWEKLSAELNKEMAGAPENTEPLTAAERLWYRSALADTGPKIKVTIRLRRWQILRAKQLAREKGLRGYQTLLDEILTRELLP